MRILVSGAGVAGLSAGVSLGARGHDVTIVERADHLRTNGAPIDVRGDAIDVARRMGVLAEIERRRITMTQHVQFVDRDGTVIAGLPTDEFDDSADDIEIPREDLTHILRDALPASARLVLRESVTALDDDGDGVDVTLASGDHGRFDLVVGADGLHSATRRMTFGPEADYRVHLGCYVALTTLPDAGDGADRDNPMLNWPGHSIGISRYHDVALGVLMFRSAWIDHDHHDLDAQRRIVLDAFAGHDEWRVPEILDAVRHDPELYFDAAAQIHMPSWHTGRVVLVGDAAHAASGLTGRGTSLALTGTWFLAEALRRHPDDLEAALQAYETDQRPHVTRSQATAAPDADLVVPATRDALDHRNERLRAAAPA